MREIRVDWEKFGQIRRSPGAGGRCFLAIIRVYFIASAIFLRNCLVPSHALERPFGAVTPLERRDEYYALFVFVGGAVAVCFEGCCGSMCWPVDRPATHAAAGAAARGALIFCFGDCFTCSELGNDTMTMGGCCRLF